MVALTMVREKRNRRLAERLFSLQALEYNDYTIIGHDFLSTIRFAVWT